MSICDATVFLLEATLTTICIGESGLDPQDPGLFRTAKADVEIPQPNGQPPIEVLKGQTVFPSIWNAGYDVRRLGKLGAVGF